MSGCSGVARQELLLLQAMQLHLNQPVVSAVRAASTMAVAADVAAASREAGFLTAEAFLGLGRADP